MGRRLAPRERSTASRAGSVLLCLTIALGGCALRQTIVLMPDPSGHVGSVEVTTAGGTQRLTKAGEMTSVSGAAAPPSAVTTADPAWVEETFAEAMDAEPAPVLYFKTGTTILQPKSRAAIPIIAELIKRRGVVVTLSGHADTTGPDPLNDQLSLERAERIKALLIEQGVAPEQLTVSFHGKRIQAVPTPDGVAEPRNRRVEANLR
jgi:outer membrane protein OmpA-like peptidoglycan-associated protein